MKKGLFIVYNSAGLENFLQIRKKINNVSWDCCIYEKYYNDQEKLRHFTNFIYRNNRKYKFFNKICNNLDDKYNFVLCPSEFDGDINVYLKRNYKTKTFFYQTGLSDYVSESNCKRNPELFLNSTKFVENTQNAKSNFIKNLNKVNLFDDIISINKIYDNEIRSVKKIENIDAVVFVDPIDIDFGYLDFDKDLKRYLTSKYFGKNILFKFHPRSDIKLDCDSYNSLYCNDNLPGEILLDMMIENNVKDIIFTFPNMVLMRSEINVDLIKFNSDKMYVNIEQYETVFDKDIINKNEKINLINLSKEEVN